MLTGIVLVILYGADIGFVSFLLLGIGLDDLFTVLVGSVLCHLLMAILLTRTLARFFPVDNGRFSNGTPQYDRWRAQGVIAIVSSGLFDQFVPVWMKAGWFRLFGAKLDRDVVIGGRIIDPPLVIMKQGSALGAEAMILGHHVAKDHVVIGRVWVGPNAMIGARALVMPNVEIGEDAVVGACALVTSGKKLKAGETWVGIPAKPLNDRPEPNPT